MIAWRNLLHSFYLLRLVGPSVSTTSKRSDGAARGWSVVMNTNPNIKSSPRKAETNQDEVWSYLANLSPNVVEFGASSLPSGDILAFGGFSYSLNSASNATMRYSAASDSWNELGAMPGARQGSYGIFVESLGSGQGVVMAVGGCTGSDPTTGALYVSARVDAFDVATETWYPEGYLPDLPVALMGASGATLPDGRVVVTGGFGYYEGSLAYFYSNRTFVLDPSEAAGLSWDETPFGNFPWARSAMGCASTSRGVLCSGGGSLDPAYSDAAIYNGTTNSWNIVAPMLEARNYFGMATTSFSASMLDTKNKPDGNRKNKVASTFVETDEAETVYAVGGYCCSSYPTYCFFSPLASTEKFDVLTGVWSEASALPDPHAGLQAASPYLGKDTVVAIGGNSPGDVLIATSP